MAYEKPISLSPLTPEEALRRAMQAPVPKDDPPPVPKKQAIPKKTAKKPAATKPGE